MKTESIEYPCDNPEIKISLVGTYEKIDISCVSRLPNGVEERHIESTIIFKPIDQPIVGTSSLSVGGQVKSQNQKTIPFFLIGECPCYDEFASLIGKRVFIEGSLEQSNDLFFFHTPQIHLDYVVEAELKNKPCKTCSYKQKEVVLEGSLYKKTYPGPPEYASIENGDSPETSWILALKNPIHVGEKSEYDDDHLNSPEKYVIEVVVVPPDDCSDSVMNKKVRVTGSLFHAHTGHHARRILCDAKRIDSLD
jgi:hypothetical protein